MPRKSSRCSPGTRTVKHASGCHKIVYPTATTLAGQRRQVWEGTATMTRGGLRKQDLTVSKVTGVIVPKSRQKQGERAHKENGLSDYHFEKERTTSRQAEKRRESPAWLKTIRV